MLDNYQIDRQTMPENAQPTSTIALAEQLAAEITRRIETGGLRPGERLPSVREAARSRGISTFTVSDAYQRLTTRGLLVARRGAGYFVAPPLGRAREVLPALSTLPIDDDWLLSRIYQRDPAILYAGCGWLPDHWYDRDANSSAMRTIARRKAPFHPYGDPQGYEPLRREIARGLCAQHLQVGAEQVLMTQGASKALDMVACTLAEPGDTVLIDEPGYCNLISCLRLRGFKPVGVPWNADGPDCERLAALLAQHKPRLFFSNPLLNNPSGASYTLATAYRVMKLLDDAGCTLVEDNVAQPFHPAPPPPLCSLGGAERHVYIGSFSKSLAPGLRVGYVVASQERIERLLRYKMITGLTTPVLNEMLAMELAEAAGSRRQLNEAREALQEAQHVCQQRFDAAGWTLFARPAHGLFLLARPPHAAPALAEQARDAGIVLAPGRLFSCDGSHDDWWRFNVAYSRNSRLWDFLGALRHQ
ncbi:PLP-dependent aminotransferase family protein [Crenobacter caeni]|uniref:Putative 8-amino-7-oxononanoate synthase n=1 Tax=Crenobacter caeni TaxID=2705474 RepID=A0A6B2KN60_9NEIS|nr:PLP-dependent aminotransferase family protein [Crenobacter caeni]NDV11531.1 PLP-dependent aminotransferase family protein [Crenobacter caeni]